VLRRLTFAAAAGLLAAAPATAALIHLRVADPSLAGEKIKGVLRATPERCAPVVVPFELDGGQATVELDLCGDGVTALSVEAPGWWGGASAADPHTITLHREALISGVLGGDAKAVFLRIESANLASQTESCELKERRFRCRAPARIPLDLRLAADALVPHYFFDVTAPAGMGTLSLESGASIAGFVETKNAAAVELSSEGKRIASRRANARGFYQFTRVPAGTLTVAAAGTVSRQVHVSQAVEHLVPLQVAKKALFALTLSPPADPDGLPWRIEVTRRGERDGGATMLRTIAAGVATPDGRWSTEELEEAEYAIAIRDAAGSVHHTRDLTIASGDPPLHVNIEQVSLRGRVTLGGEPVQAKVSLSGPEGAALEIATDEDGRFRGVVPAEGEWNAAVWPAGTRQLLRRRVHIHRADGASHATVELELPGGRLEGVVVDDRGRGVAANLTVVRDGRIDVSGGTEEDGTFSLVGLREGTVQLVADGVEGTSNPLACTIDDDRRTTVRVALQRRMELDAIVVTDGGAPVAGAIVGYFAPTFLERRESVSGPSGRVSLELPANTPRVTVVVIPPGFPRKVVTVPIDPRSRTLRFVVGQTAATLRVRLAGAPPWPFVRAATTDFVSLGALSVPGRLRDDVDGNALRLPVEAGEYTLCPEAGWSDRCRVAVLAPGGEGFIDATGFYPRQQESKQ